MRIVLAIASFVIAAPFLAWAAVVAYQLVQVFGSYEEFFSEPEVRFALALDAGSAFIGLVFLVAGVAMLAHKPRASQ